MYEDRSHQTQNYDPEIHEEYLIHDTRTVLPATSLIDSHVQYIA